MKIQKLAITVGLIASSLIIIKVFIDLADRKKRLAEEKAIESEIKVETEKPE